MHVEPLLVLSLFPGAGLLDFGFARAGFCVVRGPDVLLGGHIEDFTPPAGHFEGVIGGPPCQDFSRARRRPPSGHGASMLDHFCRCVAAAEPHWFLMENVPGVPTISVSPYTIQRFNLLACEFGVSQRRTRSYHFGSTDGVPLSIPRSNEPRPTTKPAVLARDGRGNWRELARLQGLPHWFDLPGLHHSHKVRAIGNGVPVPVAHALAVAIRDRAALEQSRRCACGCGRILVGHDSQRCYNATCRKRLLRLRRAKAVDAGTATQ